MESHAELCFPTFLSDGLGFKDSGNSSRNFDLNNTNIVSTVLVSTTPSNSDEKPSFLPKMSNLLIIPNQGNNVLVEKGNLQLLAWTYSGKRLSSQIPEERTQSLITNRPGVSGIAAVVGERLNPLNIL